MRNYGRVKQLFSFFVFVLIVTVSHSATNITTDKTGSFTTTTAIQYVETASESIIVFVGTLTENVMTVTAGYYGMKPMETSKAIVDSVKDEVSSLSLSPVDL